MSHMLIWLTAEILYAAVIHMTYQLHQKGCLHDNAQLVTSLVAWERGYTAGILIDGFHGAWLHFWRARVGVCV